MYSQTKVNPKLMISDFKFKKILSSIRKNRELLSLCVQRTEDTLLRGGDINVQNEAVFRLLDHLIDARGFLKYSELPIISS